MPDRNKVIEAFERCFCEKHSSCPGCYQDGPGFGVECRKALLLDVLALLKEQESVEPILALNDGEHKLWQCGNCKVAVFTRDTKYCHNCGKAVKWE